jgi:hypothetical protein
VLLVSERGSFPANDMVDHILRTHAELEAEGVRLGAVGSRFSDLRIAINYSFQAAIAQDFFYGYKASRVHEPHVEAGC